MAGTVVVLARPTPVAAHSSPGSALISTRLASFTSLVESRLPPLTAGTSRHGLSSALVGDWHPPTRDNYLAVFDEFVRWYEGRVGPLGTQVEGSALLEFGYHLLHRPSRRSPSATLAVSTV